MCRAGSSASENASNVPQRRLDAQKEVLPSHYGLDAQKAVHVQMARDLISSIIVRLHANAPADSPDNNVKQPRAHVAAPTELEVRWMATGELACVVNSSSQTCLSEVKQQLLNQVNIPLTEQHLFASGVELHADVGLKSIDDSNLLLVRSAIDPRITNLADLHCSPAFANLNPSSFSLLRKVSSGINGDIFKYIWRCGQKDVCVAVKKLRERHLRESQGAETNERAIHLSQSEKRSPEKEDALTEIGVLSYLSKQPDLPANLLKMQGVFAEPQQFTWLVTEFADGGELFDVVVGGGVSDMQIQTYTWQMLRAVEYLHRHHIAHRDISLENALLKDGVVKVMDFGMAVRSHSPAGVPLRYFRLVGKNFYRAPECYVPACPSARVTVPTDASPGDVVMAQVRHNFLCEVRLPEDIRPGQVCSAEIWGYEAAPMDVFAVGICMFILSFKCPAWEVAQLTNPYFAHVHRSKDNGIESLLKTWGKQCPCPGAMAILKDMLQINPSRRPPAASCLEHSWFSSMAATPETSAPPQNNAKA